MGLEEQLTVSAGLALIHARNGATSSDFTDTAFISTIHAFDINGNELTDFTVTSESGFDYPTGPLNATPEPNTLLLWATAMAGLGPAARWRRRRQN